MTWLILLVNGDNTMSNGISIQARSQAGVRAVGQHTRGANRSLFRPLLER